MLSFSGGLRVFVAIDPCDMRKGFNGLPALITGRLQENPQTGALLVFTNKRCNRIKILFWDRTGLWVCTKRLEQGYDAEYFAELTAEELRITFRRGFAHRGWHKMRARNEALDVRVYGLAMVRWLNPDWLRVQRSQRP